MTFADMVPGPSIHWLNNSKIEIYSGDVGSYTLDQKESKWELTKKEIHNN